MDYENVNENDNEENINKLKCEIEELTYEQIQEANRVLRLACKFSMHSETKQFPTTTKFQGLNLLKKYATKLCNINKFKLKKLQIKRKNITKNIQTQSGIRLLRLQKEQQQKQHQLLLENKFQEIKQIGTILIDHDHDHDRDRYQSKLETEKTSKISKIEKTENTWQILFGKINCYICKKNTNRTHTFYDSQCFECGEFNFKKRSQTSDLKNKICFVTGGRVKIGYEICLKLLRAGAIVHTTSRFKDDAHDRYSREPDYCVFKERLFIHRLYLQDIKTLNKFLYYFKTECVSHLDILINNAAQTIRRPPQFYKHLIDKEIFIEKYECDNYVENKQGQERMEIKMITQSSSISNTLLLLDIGQSNDQPKDDGSIIISDNKAISSVNHTIDNYVSKMNSTIIMKEDEPGYYSQSLFPIGQYDKDGQQLDLRTEHTWTRKFEQIDPCEMLEVSIINSFAPSLIIYHLLPLMKSKNIITNKYIINVSSMEGVFEHTKKTTHPHTNMAKASLNMLGYTMAKDLIQDRIYLNSVDTGWVTNEYGDGINLDRAEDNKFNPPLDEIDGASRVLDPIFSGIEEENKQMKNNNDKLYNARKFPYGLFFKDYKSSAY